MLQTFLLSRDKLQEVKAEKASELDFLEKQTLLLTTEMKDKIKAMVEEVERKVKKLHLYMHLFLFLLKMVCIFFKSLIFCLIQCNKKFYLICRFLML